MPGDDSDILMLACVVDGRLVAVPHRLEIRIERGRDAFIVRTILKPALDRWQPVPITGLDKTGKT